ncbi:hypothetical protein [Arthrobacter sp. H16F315]|uniref:hypothetical protein n=1 Tax=Arthrobacter sp. H16F315 TaxID=2955314 RepID=UPI0021E66C04|nr:hypothetical protein [Arthrobacter sp. H16F315]MDD1477125.1 hypothetical protein [Arthrobacter sp. H16F315]
MPLSSFTAKYCPVPPAFGLTQESAEIIPAPLKSQPAVSHFFGTRQAMQYLAVLANFHPARPKSRLQI